MVCTPSLPGKEACTVITGGLGGLGSAMATWILQQGASHVHLLGRSAHRPLPPALAASAARVTVAMADVGIASDLALPTHGPQIGCVLHAAGVLRDGTLAQQSAACLRTALAPKAGGALLLEALLRWEPVCRQLLFSSVAGALGSPGQLNYAAANAQLDHLAVLQQQRGMGTCSLQWGPFEGAGMALRDQSTIVRVQRMGMQTLSMQQGLGVVQWALHRRTVPPVVGAHPMDWHLYLDRNPAAACLLPTHTEASSRHAVLSAHPIASIERVVAAAVVDAIGHPIPGNAPLMSAGLDSLAAVEFRNALSRQLGIDLPATLIFDHPTVNAVVEFVRTYAMGAVPPMEPVPSPMISLAHTAARPVAIVTYAHKAPVTLSNNNVHGVDSVHLVDRWSSDDVAPRFGSRPVCFASLLRDVADFDPAAFALSSAEAAMLDPQQRILLECAAEALGKFPNFDPQHTGVFVGVSGTDYARMVLRYVQAPGGYAATAGAASVVSGRLSYTFGLQVWFCDTHTQHEVFWPLTMYSCRAHACRLTQHAPRP